MNTIAITCHANGRYTAVAEVHGKRAVAESSDHTTAALMAFKAAAIRVHQALVFAIATIDGSAGLTFCQCRLQHLSGYGWAMTRHDAHTLAVGRLNLAVRREQQQDRAA